MYYRQYLGRKIADMIYILDDGRIISSGKWEEIDKPLLRDFPAP